jgi:hypothetical protein
MSKNEFRRCEFCGCITNARIRACCDEGGRADLAKCHLDLGAAIREQDATRKLSATEPSFHEQLKQRMKLQDGSPCNKHNWDVWHTTSDQHGLLSPASDGFIYSYKRECQNAGCHAVEYIEELLPKGRRVIDHGGQRFPRITQL